MVWFQTSAESSRGTSRDHMSVTRDARIAAQLWLSMEFMTIVEPTDETSEAEHSNCGMTVER